MLRKELKDTDIPHRTTIRKRVQERLEELLDTLRQDMKVSAVLTHVD